MNGKNFNPGVCARGIVTPFIQAGDDVVSIVYQCVMEQSGGTFGHRPIVCLTEAALAMAQDNLVPLEAISKDIEEKYKDAKTLVIVDPIQSRNRILDAIKAIASTPSLEKVIIVFTYPSDEVGNRFITNLQLIDSGLDMMNDILTEEEFIGYFGEPSHEFTGQNYIERFKEACCGKGEIIFCNNFAKLYEYTGEDNYLVCSIHRKDETRILLERSGAKHIYDLGQIMSEPVEGYSGYNAKYGLYGSNLMAGNRLKLMPNKAEQFVYDLQKKFMDEAGVHIEAAVFGDGAFKDPVGGIWELADPEVTLAVTEGLEGQPEEVKLKYILSANEGKSKEEIQAIIDEELKKRKESKDISTASSLGTTPRRKKDLIGSLSDLVIGSGNRRTPVVLIENYLD